MKVIYVGAGEFWLSEAVYGQVRGVIEVVPGYMGGTVPNPSHEVVATGTTGHAEVVKIIYDEDTIALESLLDIFYALHDPAAPIHSGRGIGSQYRPVIFYTDDEEGEAANPQNGVDVGGIQKFAQEIQAGLPEGVTLGTEIVTATEFYPADESHYGYYNEHPTAIFSSSVIEPRLQEIKTKFPELFS